MGSQSLHRRIIVTLTLFSAILSFYILRANRTGEGHDDLWYTLMSSVLKIDNNANQEQEQEQEQEKFRQVICAAIISSLVPTTISLIFSYPLPLDTIFCPLFVAYLTGQNLSFYPALNTILISYVVMPLISACFTWLIYRILIKGILYADEQERFKKTLSWCGLIYPIAFASIITAFSFTNFIHSFTFYYKILTGCFILFGSFGFGYAAFKIIFRAWLKRRAFLLYPQEYAVYMERSEKVEQGDREARGLGPIQDYYLPRISEGSSNSVTTITTKNNNNNNRHSDSNFTIVLPSAPAISPAVIAGKLAIISKRSEELFRPINDLMSICLLLILSSFESFNLMTLVKASLGLTETPHFLLWPALLFILIGGIFFSQRSGTLLGRNIIHEMKVSQAFAIQLGTLLTLTLVLFLHCIPPAPMWYLLASIGAVRASISRYMDNPEESQGAEQKNNRIFSIIVTFWSSTIIFSICAGVVISKIFV